MPMANVKQMMMKLIEENPSFLTSGIPNELLTQMIMTSRSAASPAATTGVSRVVTGGGGGAIRGQNSGMAANTGDAMKVKQAVDYNVCFVFQCFCFFICPSFSG